jgi:hypothetical protein
VAWISELKNTLSTVLYLASALTYLRFDETRRRGVYAASLALFLLALASKTVTATLPASLLIVLWWRRGRIEWRDVVPLVPFVAAGLAAGLLTAWVERTFIGAQGAEFHLTLPERFIVAGRAVWFYAETLVWPSSLTFVYPRWILDSRLQYLYPAAFAALVAAGWAVRGRTRAPFAVALLFAAALLPALGIVDVFPSDIRSSPITFNISRPSRTRQRSVQQPPNCPCPRPLSRSFCVRPSQSSPIFTRANSGPPRPCIAQRSCAIPTRGWRTPISRRC